MPRVYFIAVCNGSSLDQRSNNFSLFNLIEQVQVSQFPAQLPFEVHVYAEFDEAERGRPHEFRVLLEDQQSNVVWRSRATSITSLARRYRMVGEGLNFQNAGFFYLAAEARPAGDETFPWSRSASGWPLEVRKAEEAAPVSG